MSAPPALLAVVVSHPTQYYSPWFRWLATHGWKLRVFYLWDFGIARRHDPEFGQAVVWDVDLLSGYEHEFVPNTAKDPGTHHFFGLNNPTLAARLRVWRPDVVLLFGYKYVTHLRLIFSSHRPLLFRGDSHLLDHPKSGLAKHLALTAVYRRFAAVTSVGIANDAYFRSFGVPPRKIFRAPHCVDAEHFSPTEAHLESARRLRADLGLIHHRVVLFAGKLIPKKQPRELLAAFLAVAGPGAALVFVGSGEDLPALRELAKQKPEASVHFLPFANQSEMPSRYLLADVFTLPSRGPGETWGLAVNEAMHLGVPCLVSNRVGCQLDLVTEGETGWVFEVERPESLADALHRALTEPDLPKLRTRVQARIAGHSYNQAAAGLARAVVAALPAC